MKASLLFGAVLVFLLFTLTLKEGFTSSPSDLMNNQKKIFVLFYNKNCSHCQELKPAWDKIEAAHGDTMTSVDLTNNSDTNVEAISKKFNINAFPTMLVIENGKVSDTYNGGRTEDELTNYVKNL